MSSPFSCAEDGDRIAAEAAEPGDDRLVVAELPVAGERLEIGDEPGDVVLGVRPVGMAGDLRLLPGRQPRIDVGERVARLLLERGDLVGDGNAVALARLQPFQLLDLAFQVGDRLFEIEECSHALLGRRDPLPAGPELRRKLAEHPRKSSGSTCRERGIDAAGLPFSL